MKLSGPADSLTDTGFEIFPRFEGVIGQNKIQRTYDHDCILHFWQLRRKHKFSLSPNPDVKTSRECFLSLLVI